MIEYPLTDETRLMLRYTIDGEPHWLRNFTSFDACQRIYASLRDESGLGASRFGEGEIFDQFGQYVARISYNARLWSPLPWTPGVEPWAEAPRP